MAILAGDMRRLLREHPDIAVKLLAALSRRLRETNERLDAAVVPDRPEPRGRRARRAGRRGALRGRGGDGDVLITATQTDLAQLAGSSRESASRFLAVLERAGIITQGRGKLTVHDPGALERLCLLSSERRARGVLGRRGGRATATRSW